MSSDLNRPTNYENKDNNKSSSSSSRHAPTNSTDQRPRPTSFFGSLLSTISIPISNSNNQSDSFISYPRSASKSPSSSFNGSDQSPVSTIVSLDNMSSYSPRSTTSSIYDQKGADQSKPEHSQSITPNQSAHHRSFSTSPYSNHYNINNNTDTSNGPIHRRASLSHAWSGFMWPNSAPKAESPPSISASLPKAIPDSQSPQAPSGSSLSTSLPSRRASTGPAFRRAFELPTYSSLDEERASPEPPPARGRSGSMLSSFGFSESRPNEHYASAANSARRSPAKRKLSPMGERMIRDHIF